MRSRAGAAVLVVLSFLMGACADDGEPTVAEEPKPVSGDAGGTSTTTPIDVSTIPAKIDERYVNAVLAGLDEVKGQAVGVIVKNKKFVPEAAQHLRAIYGEEEFQQQVEVWLRQLQKGLHNFKPDPGSPRTSVARLVSASPTCISMEVQEDASGFLVKPGPYTKEFVQLVPLDRSRDKRSINPTAWMIHRSGLTSDGSDPGDLCAD